MRRRAYVHVLFVFIFSMAIFDWLFIRDDFPFSAYAMYAKLIDENDRWDIAAVSLGGENHLKFYCGNFDSRLLARVIDKAGGASNQRVKNLLKTISLKNAEFHDFDKNRLYPLRGFRIFHTRDGRRALVFETMKDR